MPFLAFLIGIGLPTLNGWLLLQFFERKHPILLSLERWALGFVIGSTGSMVLVLLLHIAGVVSLSLWGFLVPQVIVLILLTILLRNMPSFNCTHLDAEAGQACLPAGRLHILRNKKLFMPSINLLSVALLLYLLLKLTIGSTFLALPPPFLDDTYDNWNLRGKVLFVEEQLDIFVPEERNVVARGITSYPPTMPMFKAWLSRLAGKWHEPLVNSVHLLWYAAALALLFCLLRRHATMAAAMLGTYGLASIPLFLIQGSHPYADAFLSVHIFAAISMLFSAATTKDEQPRIVFLSLAAITIALLPFVKNEGLLLYMPPLLLLFLFVLWKSHLSKSKRFLVFGFQFVTLLLTVVPWLLFKWMHALPFGNAKPISGLSVSWQPGVLRAIGINTFLEGNWILLFPLFIGLVVWKWRTIMRSPLLLPTFFVLIVIAGQIGIYLFTPLSTEALNQTGFARGLIHLIPVMIFLVIQLLAAANNRGKHF